MSPQEHKVRILYNPRAGAGASERLLPEVERGLRKLDFSFDVVRTERPRDAVRLVEEATKEGITALCVMGGDGTLNEVSHAFVSEDGQKKDGPAIVVVPAGTGGDFKRSLGLSGDVTQALSVLRSGEHRDVDLGHLTLVSDQGTETTRVFLNVTSFGMGGVVDRLVNDSPKWLGGKASFFLGSLRAMATYSNEPVIVTVDGELFHEGPIFSIAMANGKCFGGGMLIAPDAELTDELFDVVSLGDFTRREAVTLSSSIYKGTHLSHHKVNHRRGKIVEARPVHPSQKVLIDMDGETPGRLPLRATVVPGAMRVFVPRSRSA